MDTAHRNTQKHDSHLSDRLYQLIPIQSPVSIVKKINSDSLKLLLPHFSFIKQDGNIFRHLHAVIPSTDILLKFVSQPFALSVFSLSSCSYQFQPAC
jgi:hypothetical protein